MNLFVCLLTCISFLVACFFIINLDNNGIYLCFISFFKIENVLKFVYVYCVYIYIYIYVCVCVCVRVCVCVYSHCNVKINDFDITTNLFILAIQI
jgi:hypothetical protein